MRCTAPINAPWPPPTMPRRTRFIALVHPEHAAVRCVISAGRSEVVKCFRSHLDDVVTDERSTLTRTLLRRFDRALPLQHRPAGKAVLRQLGEDATEIH